MKYPVCKCGSSVAAFSSLTIWICKKCKSKYKLVDKNHASLQEFLEQSEENELWLKV